MVFEKVWFLFGYSFIYFKDERHVEAEEKKKDIEIGL